MGLFGGDSKSESSPAASTPTLTTTVSGDVGEGSPLTSQALSVGTISKNKAPITINTLDGNFVQQAAEGLTKVYDGFAELVNKITDVSASQATAGNQAIGRLGANLDNAVGQAITAKVDPQTKANTDMASLLAGGLLAVAALYVLMGTGK